MDYAYLAELLFPDVKTTPEDMEKRYPPRNLPEDAKVTRFAPSPTGFVHFGGLFPTRVGERLAHQSGGVFFLRIEDTDMKRKVEGAEENLISILDKYNIRFDEGVGKGGDYGPYRQSERCEIYHTYAKYLVQNGMAYPCFCTEEELCAIRAEQEALGADPGYYGKWAKYRDADISVIEEKIKAGEPYVLRFRSNGNVENKIKFTDLVRGDIEITENDKDHVLLKSDGIPVYHFAHVVDDHLMRTTHVVRGEEWLPSLPFHLQLFRALGFKMPKFLHISQIMKLENGSKKKLSKRDNGASLADYEAEGYPEISVIEYIMILLNSNYEEWRMQNPDKNYEEFPFSLKKMSSSGCLLDIDKLNDVSKNTVSRMDTDTVYEQYTAWAQKFDNDFYKIFSANAEYSKRILSIGRGTQKPRKDITTWRDVKPYVSLFFDELFEMQATFEEKFDKRDIKKILTEFSNGYDENDAMDVWFGKMKDIAAQNGFAAETKAYKQNPDDYKGSIGDVSMFVRIAVTGKTNSPDLYEVMHIIGKERTLSRINSVISSLK
ncbi:MAG: glutamate--tRNA ligase [Clostridia bacterium]|nr:glutamate--tRNA ligase [Clostridia bacterium]